MKKTAEQKLEQKRQTWLERTMLVFGMGEAATRKLLNQERRQSLRLNPLITPPDKTLEQLKELNWQGKAFHWAGNGYTVDRGAEAVRDSSLAASGAVFIQNAASWLPVLVLDPQPGEEILDVCAAPGGKTSHIAAITNNQAHITANDNSRPRLAKLRANMQRLGVHNVEYTLFDATQLARRLQGRQFDKILLDAPCSGEGMMRLDNDKNFATWSVAHIHRLQHLQKQIINQSWQLLKPDGRLVYSTCTMAPEENEAVIDYFLRKNPDAAIEPINIDPPNHVPCVAEWNGRQFSPETAHCLRLAPSPDIAAFFVCSIKKLPGEQ